MKVTELNDSEVAVILDSLAMTRDKIKADGPADATTPNIDSALGKLQSCMTPSTYGCVVVFNER